VCVWVCVIEGDGVVSETLRFCYLRPGGVVDSPSSVEELNGKPAVVRVHIAVDVRNA
jgi:hypothetical protein